MTTSFSGYRSQIRQCGRTTLTIDQFHQPSPPKRWGKESTSTVPSVRQRNWNPTLIQDSCFTGWKQETGANCLLRNCQFTTVVERTNKLSLHHRQLANSLGRFGRWLTFLDSPRRYKSISPVRLAILKESNRISGRSDGRMRISCEIPYG